MSGKQDPPKTPESEKVSAAVAQADYNRFRQLYGPLLLGQRDESQSADATNIATGRANADTMQAVSDAKPMSLGQYNTDLPVKATQALQGQLGEGRKAAKASDTERSVQVLNAANKQGQLATKGLATVARIDSGKALSDLKASTIEDGAKANALGQVAGAGMMWGAKEGLFGEGGKNFVKNRYGIS